MGRRRKEIDENEEDQDQDGFFACYLLCSLCPRHKSRTYIGWVHFHFLSSNLNLLFLSLIRTSLSSGIYGIFFRNYYLPFLFNFVNQHISSLLCLTGELRCTKQLHTSSIYLLSYFITLIITGNIFQYKHCSALKVFDKLLPTSITLINIVLLLSELASIFLSFFYIGTSFYLHSAQSLCNSASAVGLYSKTKCIYSFFLCFLSILGSPSTREEG